MWSFWPATLPGLGKPSPGPAVLTNRCSMYPATTSSTAAAWRTRWTNSGGYAPARFGKLRKSGVPVDALALSCIGIGIATILSVLQPERAFVLMISVSIFGAMFTWFMIFVTHWFFRRHWAAQLQASA